MATHADEIRQFILQEIRQHPHNIARLVAEKFKISRQAVNRHLRQLIAEGVVVAKGNTRSREYTLKTLVDQTFTFQISPNLQEDKVWREQVQPLLTNLPENVLRICQYGLTEMLNNAIDHSEGSQVGVEVQRTAADIDLWVMDDGIGIFNKIKRDLHLDDEHHAILELSKGKLTTDPKHHTGEGIFFTSRVFDLFNLRSGSLSFMHQSQIGDWLIEDEEKIDGTLVGLMISSTSTTHLYDIFSRYASEEGDYGFTRTRIPVRLAQYGEENLVSRSQAKRLLARIERFKEVFLDFDKVVTIGQAFADQIFRVFQREHPEVSLRWMNANPEVEKMIRRAIRNPD